MRLKGILLVMAVLMLSSSLAQGLSINEVRVNGEYDEAYTYRLDNQDDRINVQHNPTDGSVLDVEVLPGSNVTFTMFIENTLKNGQELRDVIALATIKDVNDDDNAEAESIELRLDPGEDERVDMRIQVPYNVDEDKYDVTLEVQGEDKFNDILYFEERSYQLIVSKRTTDLRITKVALEPNKISCDKNTKLIAEVTNIGSSSQYDVAVEFKSNPLGINSYDQNLFLESSDDVDPEERMYLKSYDIELPDFFESGTYPIFVNVYWKNFVLFDQEIVSLKVENCGPKEQIEEIEEEPVKDIPEETFVEEPEVEDPGKEARVITQESLLSSQPFLITIVLTGLIAAIVAILIVLLILKNK